MTDEHTTLSEDYLAADDGCETDPPTPRYGRCLGGPWSGAYANVRAAEGFRLLHIPARAMWVYERQSDGSFRARAAVPEQLPDHLPDEGPYEIRTLDPESVSPTEPAG